MTKFASGAAIALALAAPGAAFAQRAPAAVIVVVDSGRIFSECTACRAASAQLQAMVASGQARAQQLGQPLQTEAQSIQQAAQAASAQPAGAARSSSRKKAEAALAPYPVGSAPTVRYNPDKPGECVLETTRPGPVYLLMAAAGLIFIVVGVVIAAAA